MLIFALPKASAMRPSSPGLLSTQAVSCLTFAMVYSSREILPASGYYLTARGVAGKTKLRRVTSRAPKPSLVMRHKALPRALTELQAVFTFAQFINARIR
jgi:hypothetical protein